MSTPERLSSLQVVEWSAARILQAGGFAEGKIIGCDDKKRADERKEAKEGKEAKEMKLSTADLMDGNLPYAVPFINNYQQIILLRPANDRGDPSLHGQNVGTVGLSATLNFIDDLKRSYPHAQFVIPFALAKSRQHWYLLLIDGYANATFYDPKKASGCCLFSCFCARPDSDQVRNDLSVHGCRNVTVDFVGLQGACNNTVCGHMTSYMIGLVAQGRDLPAYSVSKDDKESALIPPKISPQFIQERTKAVAAAQSQVAEFEDVDENSLLSSSSGVALTSSYGATET
jgi:hypothetical protein